MSQLSELLAELRALHVSLSASEGKLRLTGQASALTPELKQRIAAHKAELLALLGAVGSAAAPSPVRLRRSEGGAPRPLSYVQERIWFVERINPGTPLHNVGLALDWSGPLDPSLLARTLDEILRRHEVLRTRIVMEGDVPRQVVVPATAVTLVPEAVAPSALEQRIEALLKEPFDLAAAPLVRFRLLRLGEQRNVLLAIAHHIVWDGRSSDVFRRELTTIYDALAAGRTPELPAPAVSYPDFAIYQREASEQGAFTRELAYWKATFTPLPEPLDMPADRPRAQLRSGRGATVSMRFDPLLVSRLRALARAEQSTLQMVLLAALDVTLARCSGQPDVVVGSAYDQRELPELDPLIGCFVNTLALRTVVRPEESFTELLSRVRDVSLDALSHSAVPFERVVEMLAPPRDTSRTPLYQVMFSYQERPEAQVSPRGVRLEELTLPTGGAATDLFLWIGNRDRDLHAVLDYASDLFERETAERLLATFATLLEGVVQTPTLPVGKLPLVSAAERQRLVHALNPSEQPRATRGRVHELIEAQAARTPTATALVFEERALTYRELDTQANRIAHHLKARGAEPGKLVGVALRRTLELPLAMLAVLKTGAAYVPLDPTYPRERVVGMAEDAGVALIVTDSASKQLFDGEPFALAVLDEQAAELAAAPDTALAAPGGPSDLMYVIYTSGSTGKPKGVMVEHGNVTNFLDGMRERLTLASSGAWVSTTSVSFDISVLEIFGALSHGMKLVFIGHTHSGLSEDPRFSIAAQLERHAATHFQCTPSQALILLADPASRRALRHVRELLVGGEPLGRDVAAQLLESISGRLFNMYGPTETTIWSSTSAVTRDAHHVSLGRPIANTTFYVLDPAGELLPLGVVGELCIGGLGVARGYLGREELTRERFVPDSFSSRPGARLYRTGDLVRYRADGSLEFLGRNDFQVKIRGYRIELGEIESALRTHPRVREAAVVARDQGAADKRLVAYLVADGSPSGEELRAHLTRSGLPDYMLPHGFVLLERMPVTGSGKLDRKALPAPVLDEIAPEGRYLPPESPTEELLARLFSELLGKQSVSADEGFFTLGGHSLLAVRLVSLLREALGFELPMVLVFSHPRLRDLASAIDALRESATAAPSFPPPSARTSGPLSFAQERLWFLDQLSAQAAVHHLALALRLEGTLDVPALERALALVATRHESLRTLTVVERGVPRLEVQPTADVALTRRDLSKLAPAERDATLARELSEHVRGPIDLAHGPLLRVALFALSEADHVLCAVAHHASWDGSSLGIFQRELGIAYDALRTGEEAALSERLPKLEARYVDYAAWERERLAQGDYDAQIAFWKQKLAGAPTLDFPSDHPRPPMRSGHGAIEQVELDRSALASLRKLAHAEDATLYMALVALLDVLALRFTGQSDVVVATPIDARVRRELEGLVGMFVNTVLLRVELTQELTFRELLRRVRATSLEAFRNADVPFDRVVHAIEPPRDTSRTALYQLMFSYLEPSAEAERLGSLRAEHLSLEGREAATDLSLFIPDQGERVRAYLEYATDLYEPATARRLLSTYARLVAFASTNPDAPLHAFPAADAEELARVVAPLNRTMLALPPPTRIDRLIAEQVAKTPDATALVFRDRALTYAELDARANRLAHVLVARGARPNAFVGICIRRSEQLVVAMLAVIKAGAAYLPLDPNYPPERLGYMVDDAGAKLVLTEADTHVLLAGGPAELLCLDALGATLAAQPATPPESSRSDRDLMYVIYTSGSTGKPKGVPIAHRNVANLFAGIRERVRLSAGDRFLSGTSISFDISVLEIFGSLAHGLTLVLLGTGKPPAPGMPPAPEAPPYDIASSLARHRITHYQCTPSQARLLLEDGEARAALTHVQHLLLGGEALTADLAARLYEHVGGELINGYGPTETTVYSTTWTVPRGAARIALGRPIANTVLRVLDAKLNEVPLGVAGELYIGGTGLAPGYLGRDDLTRDRFVRDPFAETSGALLYKTGDLVRYRNDGALEYLGRNDFQVKLRGFRIELGEIEDALRSLAGAREAVVVARDDGKGDARLIAYLVPGATTPEDASALRSALRARLPDYMVPSAIVSLPSFPLTGSGKVDRARLPAPSADARSRSAAGGALASPLEQRIAQCWKDVLNVEQVGPEDNFFDLGGHSLLMGRLADEISAVVGQRVSIPELFQYPSVRTLAQKLEAPSAAAPDAGRARASERRAATRNLQGRRG